MPPRQPHPHQSPNQPHGVLRRAPRHVLPWALRGLALAALGYVLAVAVLGAMPRPAGGLPLPACCPATGTARTATEQRQGMAPSDAPGQPAPAGGENAKMADAAMQKAPLVTIQVISNGVHADIVLPARVEGEPGLAEVLGLNGGSNRGTGNESGNKPVSETDVPPAPATRSTQVIQVPQTPQTPLTGNAHLAVGWGAREFYLATPTWGQMRPGVALRALVLAPAALHVEVMPGPPLPDADTRTLHLSRQGYRNLVAFVAASLNRDAEGRPVRIPVTQENGNTGYGPGSRFFEATGRFSPLHTCNTWAADALAAAGVRTPVWTPLPHFVLYHLPAAPR
ncbi:TIGR02117 family protein [Nitratidesulfovibrio sp.]|uniref:TIGR02117 family protein n=1 Tax=Nitratidesulfovibrio sp. TaxID=2802297 RepID=UPI00333FE4EC